MMIHDCIAGMEQIDLDKVGHTCPATSQPVIRLDL